MSWFVDNANTLYILLGIIAAGFVVAWRFNQRVKFLGYAAGVLTLIALVWLLTLIVPTDRKQLKSNVEAMAEAVVAGKVDDLFKHISKDFQYKGATRQEVYAKTQAVMKLQKITSVHIGQFKVIDVSRAEKKAKASFLVRGAAAAQDFAFRTEGDFVLEDDQWRLKTMRFYNPLVNQDQEISLPGF